MEGGIGTVIEQEPDDLDAPGAGGLEERSLAGPVPHVDGRAGFEQPSGELEAASLGGRSERLGELARARLDELGEPQFLLATAPGVGASDDGRRSNATSSGTARRFSRLPAGRHRTRGGNRLVGTKSGSYALDKR